jgi:hypothetical protein
MLDLQRCERRDEEFLAKYATKKPQAVFACGSIFSLGPDGTQRGSQFLALGLLAFSSTLTNLKAWIALANNVQPTTTANDLAIRMTKLQRADRRNYLHDSPSHSTTRPTTSVNYNCPSQCGRNITLDRYFVDPALA